MGLNLVVTSLAYALVAPAGHLATAAHSREEFDNMNNKKKNFVAPQLNEEQSLAQLTLTPVTSGSDQNDNNCFYNWCW
jgi:hypothetical protein